MGNSAFGPTRSTCPGLRCLVLLVCAGALAPSCRTWEQTKTAYVTDVNGLLHKQYPRTLASGNLDALLELYGPELRADSEFVETKRAVLDGFRRIARVSCVIHDLTPSSDDGGRAALGLQIHGVMTDGKKASRHEELEVEYARSGSDWLITRERVTDTRIYRGVPVTFREEAPARGLLNVADVGKVLDRNGELQTYPGGSGVGVGDIDGDGHDDVYLVNGQGARLFRNRGDGSFEDITERAGCAADIEGKSRLALLADYDNDGRTDIFVGVLNGPNLLYRQQVDGSFREAAESAGLRPTLETNAACFADFDNDGFLDLFIGNSRNPFQEDPNPPYNARNAFPNALFMNNGDGTFRDASEAAGVAHTGYALSCATADYDRDGDIDLFVGNDFGPDVLYRNRGDGTFEDVTAAAGLRLRGSSMSASWADVDADGYPELFLSGMFSNSAWMVDQPGYPSPAPWIVDILFRSHVIALIKEMLGGNRFYKNEGDGTFSIAHRETANTGWAWASLFFDCDNDSRQDLYAVNGFVSGTDKDDL